MGRSRQSHTIINPRRHITATLRVSLTSPAAPNCSHSRRSHPASQLLPLLPLLPSLPPLHTRNTQRYRCLLRLVRLKLPTTRTFPPRAAATTLRTRILPRISPLRFLPPLPLPLRQQRTSRRLPPPLPIRHTREMRSSTPCPPRLLPPAAGTRPHGLRNHCRSQIRMSRCASR